MKIAVFFFLAMAFAVAMSLPLNMTDGAEEEFVFKNGTEVDEPEQFSNETVLDQDKEDNETISSGDFFVATNFSGTEQPEHAEEKRYLTTHYHMMDPESGSTPLDAGSADIETASGIKELPNINDEEGGSTNDSEEEEEEEEGGTEDAK